MRKYSFLIHYHSIIEETSLFTDDKIGPPRSDEPEHKKARMARSQQKLMLILFFDILGVVMVEGVPYWENV